LHGRWLPFIYPKLAITSFLTFPPLFDLLQIIAIEIEIEWGIVASADNLGAGTRGKTDEKLAETTCELRDIKNKLHSCEY
jgi:hypothetical protein